MAAAAADNNEWQSLLSQTQDLVAQDNYNFPKVDRSLRQLASYADGLRARTSKLRSLSNQVAATRLLAQQGFDASRLTADVTALEIQPTIEDVFSADTVHASVEDYLRQVEEATILTALQEAETQTVAAFDAHMDECMARDWAANKRQLYGLVAPHSASMSAAAAAAGGGGGGGGMSNGAVGGIPGTPSSAAPLQLPATEAAYVAVVRGAQQALSGGSGGSTAGAGLIHRFKAACKADSDASSGNGGSSIRGVWALVSDMLDEAKARSVAPTSGAAKYFEALAAGARKHLERGHCHHVRNTVTRHKLRAERGADPEPLREVQAFIQVKLGGGAGSKALLDFQAAGGTDTSWVQVYYCLRNGWHEAARRAAGGANDPTLARLGDGGFRAVLDDWLRAGGRLPERTAVLLARACEALLHDKAALKARAQQPYAVLVLALVAGDARSVDVLVSTLAALGLPAVLATIEDFMWSKLTLLQSSARTAAGTSDASSAAMGMGLGMGLSGQSGLGTGSLLSSGGGSVLRPYTLPDLASDINRWPAGYYSRQGKEPLLYATVLFLSLQFPAALRFLWQDDMARAFRADAVHLAIALQAEGALEPFAALAGDGGPDVGAMLQAYARKFVHTDSALALQYVMLAAQAEGGGLAVKGRLLRELLTQSRDFGTLLGAGSGPGGGALGAFIPDPEERRRLLEAIAYECQVAAQVEEAVELYLAADRPRQALALLNQQLSAALPAAAEEAATGLASTGAAEALRRVMLRARDAAARLPPTADPGSRREVEAHDTLNTAWELMLAARTGRYDTAHARLLELGCLPLEGARVEVCSRAVANGSLHPAVLERLPDMLAAAADTLAAHKAGASRDRLHTLRAQLDALCAFANAISFRVPRAVYQRLSEAAAAL